MDLKDLKTRGADTVSEEIQIAETFQETLEYLSGEKIEDEEDID